MCLFQPFVASSRLAIFFSGDPAGPSFGRSAAPRKKIDSCISKLSTAVWGKGINIGRLNNSKIRAGIKPPEFLNYSIFKFLNQNNELKRRT